jgi:hypothetical protein
MRSVRGGSAAAASTKPETRRQRGRKFDVQNEASRVHHAARRRGGRVAANGAGAAVRRCRWSDCSVAVRLPSTRLSLRRPFAGLVWRSRGVRPLVGVVPKRDFVRWPRRDRGLVGGDGHTVVVKAGDVLNDAVRRRPRCADKVDAVIYGHSHQPKIETKNGTLFFKAGSAGPRRFRLLITVGRMTAEHGKLRAEIVELSVER